MDARATHGRSTLIAGALTFWAAGCGALYYPQGTFDSGCSLAERLGQTGAAGSALAGEWTGPVSVSITDQATNQTTTALGHITVSLDDAGRPLGSNEPWPDEWPACFAPDARRTHVRNACPPEPVNVPPQQTIETLTLREAEFSAEKTRLVMTRWVDEALCPEGYRPTQYEKRTYELTVAGDVLRWSLVIEAIDDWSWGTRLDTGIITEMTGELARP